LDIDYLLVIVSWLLVINMRNFKDPLTYALYLVELRDRSVGEVEEKMRRKKFGEKEIAEVISFLESKNFVNDQRFAERFVREKQELQHWGQYRIKSELKRKHISDELINEILSTQSDNTEIDAAREAADLWRRKNPNCPKEKIYQRLGAFLSRRGFSYDVVKEILNSDL